MYDTRVTGAHRMCVNEKSETLNLPRLKNIVVLDKYKILSEDLLDSDACILNAEISGFGHCFSR